MKSARLEQPDSVTCTRSRARLGSIQVDLEELMVLDPVRANGGREINPLRP